MKTYPFEYVRVESLEELFSVLDRHGPNARIIAGGQSLTPMLNFRLARPDVLVDINRLTSLSGIAEEADVVRVGALTRHAEVAASPVIARRVPLVAEAMTHVAHPAVRNRGTFGGSLCLADPSAELPACMVALSAELTVAGSAGERTVGADDFFLGMFETALGETEVLREVTLPAVGPRTRCAMDEIARRHGDYAIVGACAVAEVADGRFETLRLVFFGVEDRPILARAAAETIIGREWSPAATDDLRAALAQDLSPNDDEQATAAMRLHLAGVLADRLLGRLAAGDGSRAGAMERTLNNG